MSFSRLSMADLCKLPPETREEVINEFVAQSPRKESLEAIDEKLDRLETKFQITSGEMKHQVAHGDLEKTCEISNWLMLLLVRERILDKW